jgi:hypothetical protein
MENDCATHKISACYYPRKGEADLTYEDIETGESVELTVKITEEEGEKLANVIPALVYQGAKNIEPDMERFLDDPQARIKTTNKLYPSGQFIDSNPDGGLALRILRYYRIQFSASIEYIGDNAGLKQFYALMNKASEDRVKEIDIAIEKLIEREHAEGMGC